MAGGGVAAATVVYSCVVDRSPVYQYQSLVWAQSLRRFGGDSTRLVVHAVSGTDVSHLDRLRSIGVEVVEVEPFDARSPYANKLAQLGSAALAEADYVVLCDCDIAFSDDISAYVTGDAIRGKVVDVGQPNLAAWRSILQLAGMSAALAPARASHAAEDTVADNFNGGLYIIPQQAFQRLGAEWPRWDSWMLDNALKFTDRAGRYADQVSFALSVRSLGLKTDPLPTALNFPTHLPYDATDRDAIEPLVLHYHDRIDADGRLKTTGMRGVDRAVAMVNGVIADTPRAVLEDALRGLRRWQDGLAVRPRKAGWAGRIQRWGAGHGR
jgi:hypothetical protein